MPLVDKIAVVIAWHWTVYLGYTWADIVFEETPGVVRIHPGGPATFSWKIDTSLDSITYGIVSFNYGNFVPDFYNKNLQGESSTWNHGYGNRANVSFTDNNQRLAFTLRETGESDTIHNYKCEVYNALTGGLDTDTDARLFIYGIPNTPTITPSQPSPPENTRFTLTCSATSTSVPDDSSIRPAMTYTWTRDNGPLPADRHTANGGDLTINPVHKDDSLVTYTCTAQETGSRLSTGAGIQIDVQYTPGQPILSVTPNPAVEGSSLRLDCNLSDDQQGNPRVYSYRWWNTDHGGNYTRTAGSLNIDSATVAEHDGLWRCVVSNAVGQGVHGQIHVTVNSASEITKPPSEQRSLLYSDNLAELCEVRAKPAALVTWSYNHDNGGTLPAGVRTQSDSEQSGKYTISRSTLQWNPEASDDQRRRTGGRFTCHGVNVIGNVSASMALTVLYGPLDIVLSDPGPITAVEGEPVSVTCSSDCSPSCTFTWTRSTLPAWSSPGTTLVLNPVTRDQHDSYICQAENGLENEKTAQVVVNVHFGSEVTSFSSSPAEVLHGDPATLVCSVSSRPNSTITISSSSNVLRSSFDQQAEYHLESASILDSGTYRCAAENYISSDIREFAFDVAGGFNLCENQESTATRGIVIRTTFEERICQFANPFPNVTRDNWMFESANVTGIDTVLPEDIVIRTDTTEHQYKKIIVFEIPQTSASHYGNYTLTTNNQYGSELIFTLIMTPDGGSSQVAIIAGILVGVVVAAALVVLLVMLWRKGVFVKKETTISENAIHYENVVVDITEGDQQEKRKQDVQYEDVGHLAFCPDGTDTKVYEGLIGEDINKTPVVYEAYEGDKTEVAQYRPSDIRPGDVISRGAVFCVQAAVILRAKHNQKARNVVIKQILSSEADVYKRYLSEAAQVLSRLAECPHVVHCAGTAADSILLENLPLGNLRQYLREMTNYAYTNTSDSIQNECTGYIEQILQGLDAVFSLTPPAFFNCLSTDHVLLGQGQICKLTGFSTAESVRQREQWEQEQGIDRPVGWLAPETIDLQHVQKSDVWGLGMVLWEIVELGRMPYEGMDERQIIEYVNQGDRLKIAPTSSPEIRDVISSCWMHKPESRRSIGKIKIMLGTPPA